MCFVTVFGFTLCGAVIVQNFESLTVNKGSSSVSVTKNTNNN